MSLQLADKVWVFQSSPDCIAATLHHVIDFDFVGEPIWTEVVLESIIFKFEYEAKNFLEESIYPGKWLVT